MGKSRMGMQEPSSARIEPELVLVFDVMAGVQLSAEHQQEIKELVNQEAAAILAGRSGLEFSRVRFVIEVQEGKAKGKSREKFVRIPEMLKAIDNSK